jgi:hypothetical protein
MWCSTCQQDVPAVNHPLMGETVCARCQQKVGTSRRTHSCGLADHGIALDDPVAVAAVATAEPLGRKEDWQARERARKVSRALRPAGLAGNSQQGPSFGTARRFDPPHQFFEDLADMTAPVINAPRHFTSPKRNAPRRAEQGQLGAWLLVTFGALALAGGLGAIGWSLWEGRPELWNLSLGITLAGQGILIFGLVLVVSRLWRNSRYATGKLQDAHVRLVELQQATEVLTATRNGGSPAFYAELVRGASPQMLLANLKGQLDQLATRLGN